MKNQDLSKICPKWERWIPKTEERWCKRVGWYLGKNPKRKKMWSNRDNKRVCALRRKRRIGGYHMNEILTINYESENPTVSARELHEKLHIGTKFTTWFERMKEYGFSEGKEFFPKIGRNLGTRWKTANWFWNIRRYGKTDLHDPEISRGKADSPVFYWSGKCMEHAGTDLCKGVENGRQDHRITQKG